MAEENKHINIKSEEIQEILGKVPHWITRFGSVFILIGLLSILFVGAVVSYPDLITGPVEINSSTPPIPLFAKTSGNIEKLFVQNNQEVAAGELLGVYQNASNEEDLFLVERKLDSLQSYPTLAREIKFPKSIELGRLQSSYSNFLTSLEDYNFYKNQNKSSGSMAYIQSQINELHNITAGLLIQNRNCNEQLQILQKNYTTNLDLNKKGIVSQQAVDESLSAYDQKNTACESIHIQISSNELKVQELKMAMFGHDSGDKQQIQTKMVLFRENAAKLRNEINLWKEQFLLIAPVRGFVSLNSIWTAQQYVEKEDEILYIVQDENAIKVTAFVNSQDIGKLAINQAVNIKLEAYNYLEYGVLQGTVAQISPVPRNMLYQIDITLEKGLTSNYGKEIPFNPGLIGSMEISCNKRSFLSRIFDKFKYLVSDTY